MYSSISFIKSAYSQHHRVQRYNSSSLFLTSGFGLKSLWIGRANISLVKGDLQAAGVSMFIIGSEVLCQKD